VRSLWDFLVPATGLECLGCASYGVAAVETGGQRQSTGLSHLNLFESGQDQKKRKA